MTYDLATRSVRDSGVGYGTNQGTTKTGKEARKHLYNHR